MYSCQIRRIAKKRFVALLAVIERPCQAVQSLNKIKMFLIEALLRSYLSTMKNDDLNVILVTQVNISNKERHTIGHCECVRLLAYLLSGNHCPA